MHLWSPFSEIIPSRPVKHNFVIRDILSFLSQTPNSFLKQYWGGGVLVYVTVNIWWWGPMFGGENKQAIYTCQIMSSVPEHLSLEWTSGSHLIHLVKAEPGLSSFAPLYDIIMFFYIHLLSQFKLCHLGKDNVIVEVSQLFFRNSLEDRSLFLSSVKKKIWIWETHY